MERSDEHHDGLAPDNVSSARGRGPAHFSELVRSMSKTDAEERYKIEADDNNMRPPPEDSISPGNGREKTVISWRENDPDNPYNWPRWRKIMVSLTCIITVLNSTTGSSLPSMAIPYIAADWHVTSQSQLVLPISVYLIGYVFGGILAGPISEYIGRKQLMLFSTVMFVIWTMACALAPNWPAFLIFRLLCGIFGSAPIAAAAGILADIYSDPVSRGRAMSWFMVSTVGGPLFAPIISGYCSTSIGWRWTFWVALIYSGVTIIPVALFKETYAPIILTRRAAKIRKSDPKAEVYSSLELEGRDVKQLITKIFYMSFEAFPIVFQDVYNLSPGVTGLCYLPIGGGAFIALGIFIAWEKIHRKAEDQGRPWAKKEEYRRVPLACMGGPLFVVSLFWLGWSARREVSFVAPILAGFPFGTGFSLIFMGMLNYLTDAYEIFAASANCASSSTRSSLAVVLPLATTPMFGALGISGACSLLGGLSLLMSLLPFVFLWKGEKLRAGSRFCLELKEQKLAMERKAAEEWSRERNREKHPGVQGSTLQDKEEMPLEHMRRSISTDDSKA
ncbi:major facilitator superfamily transporter [Xylariaceae sp. FL0804]|nr:major facilitator superfamily transporter [Xylariaceae sp. FL0804]